MSSAAPWWASAGADDLDAEQDPLAAHVAARGLGLVDDADPGGDDDGDDGGGGEDGGEAGVGGDEPWSGPGGAAGPAGHDPSICGVCPVCRGWAGLQDRHPDVAVHLAEAARHVALALTSFADAVDRERRTDPTHPADDHAARAAFTDIPLDDDRPAAP